MMFKQIPVYILILLSLGCTPSTTYINRDAEQRNQLLTEHFNNIQERLGSIESVDLISCETWRVEGDRPS